MIINQMKLISKLLLCAVLFTISTTSFSQVGIGTTTPNASSILDITSTTAGLLTPRMTAAQKTAIATPATGLLIYQTDGTAGFYYYNGSAWTPFGSTGWALTGNSGTTPATNFIGTTDAQDLVIKANGTEAMRIKNGGNIGMGTNAPTAKLHVEGTGTAPTVFTQNFESTAVANVTTTAGTNPYQINSNAGCVAADVWKVSATSASPSCTTCTTNRATIVNGGSGCNQNTTLVVGAYTSTSTSATVSFSYSYDDFSSDATDSFVATLYNETTSTVVSTLVNLSGTDGLSLSFTSGAITVVSGNNYSIRFKYTGNNAWGASVDNVSITFAGVSANLIKIVDGTQAAGKVLTSDATGNASWATPATGSDSQTLSIAGSNLSISGGNTIALPAGTGYTFTNGLTDTASTVRLGGALTASTTLSIPDTYNLNFQGTTAGASASSHIYFKRPLTTTPNIGAKTVMDVNFYDDYVNFGDGFSSPPSSDGTAFTDSGATSFTRDFVAGFYDGNSGGSGIAMGSIEEYVDGTAEFLFNYRLCPIVDNSTTLGSSTKRWSTVYAVNGTINTSDANLKKDIKGLSYGLKEIMELKPVTFKWKDEYTSSNQKVAEDKKTTKIGFLAQDLLNVLPEVVQTHSWQITDEKKPAEFLPNKNLGVFYSDIIPVAVKAIQEQQTEIETLKKTMEDLKTVVEELKRQNELLLKVANKK